MSAGSAPWLGDPRLRALALQVLVVAAVVACGWFLISNSLENLSRRSIATGFGFLWRPASFAIGESLIPYSAADSYGRAILVGLLNTLRVTVIAIVFATLIGIALGVARLSSNWLLARLAAAYVELVRNVPVLLQLFLWYAVITENLPGPRQALHPLPGVFLCNRGLMVPGLAEHPVWLAMALTFAAALIGALALRRFKYPSWWGRALVIGAPLAVWLGFGAPLALSLPELRGFNFRGGLSFSPELSSLLLGLVFYTSAYVAEIVRGGILSVSRGQVEAGQTLGLSRAQVLRLVILPQALRMIVPPLTSEYHKLAKNSSLAVAIGFPDVVSVLNTVVNQTGQAIEGVALIMAVFLAVSLGISLFMNWYNRRITLVER